MAKRKTATYVLLITLFFAGGRVFSQGTVIPLTLDKAVEIGMNRSYRIKQLRLNVKRRQAWLRAERAGLRSKVYMTLQAPNFSAVGEYKWNSLLQKDELVRQNSQTWEMQLSVSQPVILFGYPTDGYLSLNYRIYKYLQSDGYRDVSYYNRYFVKFEQPFFRPNRLKNAIEEAEIDLEESELQFIRDQVRLFQELAEDYYDLFRNAYRAEAYKRQLEVLHEIRELVHQGANGREGQEIEQMQIEVEIANVRERMYEELSNLRLGISQLKRELRIPEEDSVYIPPVLELKPVQVTLEDALAKGYTLNPRLRLLRIRRRQREIELENTKAWNSFHLNVEMTYGLEKENDTYHHLLDELDNSYSVTVNAYIPIWDWGQRDARIEARRLAIQQVELDEQETRDDIKSDIANALANLNEYKSRVLAMQEHRKTAEEMRRLSVRQYQEGKITLQDLLQNVNRVLETDLNYLEAYLGYRRALVELTTETYYDYEKGMSLVELYLGSE